mmetsp:Transcript_41263/g.99393  ORF Transcript_41263/g.99393 Transcript_41263/m.99393 type:complete len:179 (+) Transcript_41263:85-621(+)
MATRICAHRIGLLLFVAQFLSANISHAFVSEYRIHNKLQPCVSPTYIHEKSYLLASPVDALEGDNDPTNVCEDGDDDADDVDDDDDDEHDVEDVDTDDEDDDDDDNDNDNDGHEEDDPYLGSYARNEEWLEQATATVLDLEKLPLGSLTPEDISSISGLMSAWVKRCSVEACLTVEHL